MPQDDADLPVEPLSYSFRDQPESFRAVVANRIGVTATLFVTAMGLSFLLGRKR